MELSRPPWGKRRTCCSLFDSVGDGDSYPRKRIEIPIPDGKDERVVSYIVGRPIANARSPIGRATRGFVAMSKDTGKLVFLKDSWRPDIPGMMGEAHWFEKLEGARNISAFLHGSDVRCVVVRKRWAKWILGPPTSLPQRTTTDLYSDDLGKVRRMVGYIHHRTVQCEFYVPLDMFKDSKHLTQIMYDVIIGTNLLSFAWQVVSLNLSQPCRICMIGGSFTRTSALRTL